MRNLDNGAAADDGDSEGFGDGETEAILVGEWVNVEDEVLVALRADEGFAKGGDWGREVVSDGSEGRAEKIHLG